MLEDDPDLPPELKRALRRREHAPTPIPDHVDRAILAAFAHRQRFLRGRRALVMAAAAAALLIAVWLILDLAGRRPAAPGDVDGDGVVDIVDAYVLALHVEAGASDAREDVDGDGVLSRRDPIALAQRVVRTAAVPR